MGRIHSEVKQRPLAIEQGRVSILRNKWIQNDEDEQWKIKPLLPTRFIAETPFPVYRVVIKQV